MRKSLTAALLPYAAAGIAGGIRKNHNYWVLSVMACFHTFADEKMPWQMQITKDYIGQDLPRAAEALFYEKDFRGVSMREVAVRPGVGLSNIYNYFKSKDDMFRRVVASAMRGFEAMPTGITVPKDTTSSICAKTVTSVSWCANTPISSYATAAVSPPAADRLYRLRFIRSLGVWSHRARQKA